MPRWFIDFTSEAEDDLGGIDSIIRKRIIDKLDWLQKTTELKFIKEKLDPLFYFCYSYFCHADN